MHLWLRIKSRGFNKHGKAWAFCWVSHAAKPFCLHCLDHHSGTGVRQCTPVAGSVNCNGQLWVFRKAQNPSLPSVSALGSPHTFLQGFYIFSGKATAKCSGIITYIISPVTHFLFLYNFVEKKIVKFTAASLLGQWTHQSKFLECALWGQQQATSSPLPTCLTNCALRGPVRRDLRPLQKSLLCRYWAYLGLAIEFLLEFNKMPEITDSPLHLHTASFSSVFPISYPEQRHESSLLF